MVNDRRENLIRVLQVFRYYEPFVLHPLKNSLRFRKENWFRQRGPVSKYLLTVVCREDFVKNKVV